MEYLVPKVSVQGRGAKATGGTLALNYLTSGTKDFPSQEPNRGGSILPVKEAKKHRRAQEILVTTIS